MTSNYIFLLIFIVAAYFIVTDNSVAAAFYYVSKIISNKLSVVKWWIIHNPRTPWARYIIWRRSMKLAEELQKKFTQRQKDE